MNDIDKGKLAGYFSIAILLAVALGAMFFPMLAIAAMFVWGVGMILLSM